MLWRDLRGEAGRNTGQYVRLYLLSGAEYRRNNNVFSVTDSVWDFSLEKSDVRNPLNDSKLFNLMDVHYSQGPLDRKGNCRGLVRVCGRQVVTIRAARIAEKDKDW